MAYVLAEQLAKIEMDMAKAGYPKSAIYLALYNECKKYAVMDKALEYYYRYRKHRDIENQEQAKDNQPQAYQSLSYAASLVPKHFPPDSAKKNSDAFITSCERYLPCPENAKMMTDHMIFNGVAPTVEGFCHTFWILYNGGNLIRHDWDAPTNGVIKKKPPVAFSGYDVSPDLYNQEAQKAQQQQQVAASMMGMLGAAADAGLVGDKFYGNGIVDILKKNTGAKKGWGGGSDKAPPPDPKPKQVDSVPDHGGARRFRHEDD